MRVDAGPAVAAVRFDPWTGRFTELEASKVTRKYEGSIDHKPGPLTFAEVVPPVTTVQTVADQLADGNKCGRISRWGHADQVDFNVGSFDPCKMAIWQDTVRFVLAAVGR